MAPCLVDGTTPAGAKMVMFLLLNLGSTPEIAVEVSMYTIRHSEKLST